MPISSAIYRGEALTYTQTHVLASCVAKDARKNNKKIFISKIVKIHGHYTE